MVWLSVFAPGFKSSLELMWLALLDYLAAITWHLNMICSSKASVRDPKKRLLVSRVRAQVYCVNTREVFGCTDFMFCFCRNQAYGRHVIRRLQ